MNPDWVGTRFMTLLGKLSRQEKLNREHGIINGFPTVLRFYSFGSFYPVKNYKWLSSISTHFSCDHFVQEQYGREAIYNSVLPCKTSIMHRNMYQRREAIHNSVSLVELRLSTSLFPKEYSESVFHMEWCAYGA